MKLRPILFSLTLTLLFIFSACHNNDTDEGTATKSFYSMEEADQLDGEFSHLKNLSTWFTTPTEEEEFDLTAFYFTDEVVNQISRYIDSQLIRIEDMEQAFEKAEAGDPSFLLNLLELESREMRDIYLALTQPRETLYRFLPDSNDMLAVFLAKLRASTQGDLLEAKLFHLELVDEDIIENERVNLFNAMAQTFFSDEDYTMVQNKQEFLIKTYGMTQTLNDLKDYFVLQSNPDNPIPGKDLTERHEYLGKSNTFLKWISFFNSENLMGIFEADVSFESEAEEKIGSNSSEGKDEEAITEEVTPSPQNSETTANLVKSEAFLKLYDGFPRKGRPGKKSLVKELQKHLQLMGFNIKRADGYYGSGTAREVKRVQAHLGFSVNGDEVSQELFDRIKKIISETKEPKQASIDVIGTQVFPVQRTGMPSFKESYRKFGARRERGARKHAGIDMYGGRFYQAGATCNTKIYAITDGVITAYRNFYAGTHQLIVKHPGYIARYGEVNPRGLPGGLKVGDTVEAGQHIATMGKMINNPQCMLHLELFSGSVIGFLSQRRADRAPYYRRRDLLNPTDKLWDLYQKYLRSFSRR